MQNAFLISLQQTKYLMLIALIESVVNVALDYALIFGHWGLPALGFNGAAYASVISEFMGMVTVFWVIKSLNITARYNIVPVFRVYVHKLVAIFKLGFPLMSQLAISTGSWWVFFILISRNFTYDEQAVSQTMRNLFGLGGVFSWAFGSAANTIISNMIGQGRTSEIFSVIRKMVIISVTGMSFFVVILNLFPNTFFELFGQSAEFSVIGTGTLRIVSSAMIILCIGVIWLNAVVATGKTQVVFWIEFVGIAFYLLYIWNSIEIMNWSIEMAWMSEWVYWITLFALSYFYLKHGRWRDKLALNI
jgi:Na+-driven multidrug efflux pump